MRALVVALEAGPAVFEEEGAAVWLSSEKVRTEAKSSSF